MLGRTRERISDAITVSMDRSRLKARDVCELLKANHGKECNEKLIYNLRSGYVSLPLDLAVPIAKVVTLRDDHSQDEVIERYGYDPYFLIDLFGLTPKSPEQLEYENLNSRWSQDVDHLLVEKLRRLENLHREIVRREEQAISRGGVTRGLLDKVVASRKYSIAFWPVQIQLKLRSGTHIELYAADRVDFLRLDVESTSAELVWQDLREPLMTARAWPSIAEIGWPTDPSKSENASRWTIRHLDHPRPQRAPGLLPGFPPVVISAVVSSSWAGNLAGIISMVLGYGFTTTSDLARSYEAVVTPNRSIRSSTKEEEIRFTPTSHSREYIHNEMLRTPDNNQIWAHVSAGDTEFPDSPWKPNAGSIPPDLLHIRLVETDEHLEETAKRRGYTGDQVQAWKSLRDKALEATPSKNCLCLDVEYREDSEEIWEDLLRRAVSVLEFIQEHLELNSHATHEAKRLLPTHQKEWAERDRNLTYPILKLLKDRGAPLVYLNAEDHD